MLHRFWCWVSLKSQEAIVRGTRHAFRNHMANRPTHHDYGGHDWSAWNERKEQLRRYLTQETDRLHMIGGSLEALDHSVVSKPVERDS